MQNKQFKYAASSQKKSAASIPVVRERCRTTFHIEKKKRKQQKITPTTSLDTI